MSVGRFQEVKQVRGRLDRCLTETEFRDLSDGSAGRMTTMLEAHVTNCGLRVCISCNQVKRDVVDGEYEECMNEGL